MLLSLDQHKKVNYFKVTTGCHIDRLCEKDIEERRAYVDTPVVCPAVRYYDTRLKRPQAGSII